MRRRVLGLTAGFVLLALVPVAGGQAQGVVAQAVDLPNIVVIVVDDMRFDELSRMKALQARLVDHGVTFERAYVVNPLCCPSRATIFTGQYSHTTGVYTNRADDHGAWDAFIPHEGDTLATRLNPQYETALVGKYLNSYDGHEEARPPGWNHWVAFSDAVSGGAYGNYTLVIKKPGKPAKFKHYGHGTGPRTYSTDVLAKKAVHIVGAADEPLFLYFAPFAPHAPATPALRDKDVPVPLGTAKQAFGPAFNEANVSDKPAYIRNIPLLSKSQRHEVLQKERNRIRTLFAVDDAIKNIVKALGPEKTNTLFVFTSDNGLQQGAHRWRSKHVPYEESVHVPFVVRYDPLGTSGTNDSIVANVDIAPTAVGVGRADSSGMEGLSLIGLLDGSASSLRSSILVEYKHSADSDPPTYCAVRTVNKLFVRYKTGEEELYRMNTDPYQLRNKLADGHDPDAPGLRALARQLCDPLPPGMPAF